MTPPVVELRGASVSYDGRPALTGADLRVEAGEVVALLGANGSGKSTMVRALLGLVPLGGGAAELFGTPVERFREWPRLGYVPQRASAASGVSATVREVVTTGRLSRRGSFRLLRRADRDAVTAAIAAVHLLDRAGDDVATLSGGQQQRVLIARALCSEPELLVLDEPTAGVDAANQEALRDTVRLLAGRGTTVLLVTHELGPVGGLVRRAVTLAHGRVLHDGAPPDADHLHLHDPDHSHPSHDHLHAPSASPWGLS